MFDFVPNFAYLSLLLYQDQLELILSLMGVHTFAPNFDSNLMKFGSKLELKLRPQIGI
jgi:hypothetical protein